MEAEKKLLLAQNEHGAYLIRDSESRRNDYSLSVRDGDTVKHYRIRQLDEGGFFIARRTTFRTLQELVDHYSRDADGLCVNLRKPCIQVRPPINFVPRAEKNNICRVATYLLSMLLHTYLVCIKIRESNTFSPCSISVPHPPTSCDLYRR
jgi:hypothetical protein